MGAGKVRGWGVEVEHGGCVTQGGGLQEKLASLLHEEQQITRDLVKELSENHRLVLALQQQRADGAAGAGGREGDAHVGGCTGEQERGQWRRASPPPERPERLGRRASPTLPAEAVGVGGASPAGRGCEVRAGAVSDREETKLDSLEGAAAILGAAALHMRETLGASGDMRKAPSHAPVTPPPLPAAPTPSDGAASRGGGGDGGDGPRVGSRHDWEEASTVERKREGGGGGEDKSQGGRGRESGEDARRVPIMEAVATVSRGPEVGGPFGEEEGEGQGIRRRSGEGGGGRQEGQLASREKAEDEESVFTLCNKEETTQGDAAKRSVLMALLVRGSSARCYARPRAF